LLSSLAKLSYEALTVTSAGLECSPTEHASIRWTHFRTAGFPQYGFKADVSDDAFLSADLLKPAPGVRSAAKQFASIHVLRGFEESPG
jgi:hypothetical protein